MSPSRARAAALGGSADDVEAAFYDALQAADVDRLMACWSDDDETVCVHPGGPRVVGHAAIRATFEAILSNGSLRVWPEHVRRIETLTSVVHNVLERIEVLTETGPARAYVLATNVYHKTAQGWRMVVHHASPGSEEQGQEISDTPQVLH
jgi:ketosteroid isomerase-like protein